MKRVAYYSFGIKNGNFVFAIKSQVKNKEEKIMFQQLTKINIFTHQDYSMIEQFDDALFINIWGFLLQFQVRT